MANPKKVTFTEGSGGPVGEEMDPEKRRRLAELEIKVRHRKECERKAQVIVERLLENPISEDFLTGAAQFLHVSQYVDVTEERAIARLCGYPLCSKLLPKQPKQKYHISLRDKKVYDITERKNFCSNQCYKSSKHFENQVSSTAVWARQKETPVKFSLLPLNAEVNRGRAGEVVVTDPAANIRLELETLEHEDKKWDNSANKDPDKTLSAESGVRPGVDSAAQEVGLDELAEQVSEMLLIDRTDQGVNDTIKNDSHGKPSVDRRTDSDVRNVERAQGQSPMSEDGDPKPGPTDRPVTPAGSDVKQQAEALRVRPVPVNHKPDVTADANSKGRLLMDLLDRRDQLRGQGQVTETPPGKVSDPRTTQDLRANSPLDKDTQSGDGEVTTCPRPGLDQSSGTGKMAANEDTDRVAKVSSNSVIDNIRRVSSQQKVAKQGRSKKTRSTQNVSPLTPIRNALLEWSTPETVAYLRQPGPQDEEAGLSDFDKKYAQLGRRVGAADLSGVLGEEVVEEDTPGTRPLPDYTQLQRDTAQLEVKVREFYKGSTRFPVLQSEESASSTTDSGQQDSKLPVPEDGERPVREPVMPLVDSHSQTAMRRKIVFNKLDRAVPVILTPLRLPVQEVAGELRELVRTFRLTATNIILKTGEWTLMAFFLLRLLALKKPSVDAALTGDTATTSLRPLLAGLGITDHMVDQVVHQVAGRDARQS